MFRSSNISRCTSLGISAELWRGKRILITGHTGFKGSWLALLLKELGVEVIGLSMPPKQPQSLFSQARINSVMTHDYFVDIRDAAKVEKIFQHLNIDYVFHLAAQAFVRNSIQNPLESITTNVTGTANILIASLASKTVLGVTNVTTDKVYENFEAREPFKESDRLGGNNPYSASKAAVELISTSLTYSCNPRNIPVTMVRAGNVIGGGDWGEDRLVPDLVRSLYSNSKLLIRNPNATRPWQHVLDCLYGYMLVAQSHFEGKNDGPRAINFGPGKSMAVMELIRHFEVAFDRRAAIEISKSNIPENNWLELNSQLANDYLGWQTSFSTLVAVTQTAEWYSRFERGKDAQEMMREEIEKFKLDKW